MDLILVNLVNKAKEREIAQKKALAYSRKCRMSEIRNWIMLMLSIVVIGIIGTMELHAEPEYLKANPVPEKETVYIIADVLSARYSNGNAVLSVEMQTGDIEEYEVMELDFCPSEVVFKTTNIDKFESYEVVGLR